MFQTSLKVSHSEYQAYKSKPKFVSEVYFLSMGETGGKIRRFSLESINKIVNNIVYFWYVFVNPKKK